MADTPVPYRSKEYNAAIFWKRITADRDYNTPAKRELARQPDFIVAVHDSETELSQTGTNEQHDEYVDGLINDAIEHVVAELQARIDAASDTNTDLNALCKNELGLAYTPAELIAKVPDDPKLLCPALELLYCLDYALDLETSCGGDAARIEQMEKARKSESIKGRHAELYRTAIAQGELSQLCEPLGKIGIVSVPHSEISATAPTIENPEEHFLIITRNTNLDVHEMAQKIADIVNSQEHTGVVAYKCDIEGSPEDVLVCFRPMNRSTIELSELTAAVDRVVRTLDLERLKARRKPDDDTPSSGPRR